METLYEIYKGLIGNDKLEELLSADFEKNSEETIRKIFQNHQKGNCFFQIDGSKIKLTRSFHSVSMYLLGLYLLSKGLCKFNENFGLPLNDYNFNAIDIKDTEVSEKVKDGANYIWTLTSLYHDVMTSREESEVAMQFSDIAVNPFITPKNFIPFSEIFGDEKLKYTIFEDDKEITEAVAKVRNGFEKARKTTYSENIINGYFRKRLCDNRIDHGIASGYVFYDALVKNYLSAFKEAKKENPSLKLTDEFKRQKDGATYLKYRPEHLLLFRHIADAIIVHNIWRYNETSRLNYYKFGLFCDELATGKHRLNSNDNALAFFLCLVDTIEPTKFFDDFSLNAVLNGIEIECFENHIKLKVNDKLPLKTDGIANWFSKKPRTMGAWLDVDVSTDENICTIQINNASPATKPRALSLGDE